MQVRIRVSKKKRKGGERKGRLHGWLATGYRGTDRTVRNRSGEIPDGLPGLWGGAFRRRLKQIQSGEELPNRIGKQRNERGWLQVSGFSRQKELEKRANLKNTDQRKKKGGRVGIKCRREKWG